jgi:DNA mismatch endonuclease (patch repair protein)
MTDVLTPAQRRRCMAAIRGKDTKPEMIVRKLVHAMGYRYRLHRKNLPGKPDLVFSSRKKVIFVHGCFWHMHNCRYGRVRPKTNAEFWQAKREATVVRDRRNRIALRASGWRLFVVWECQAKDSPKLIISIQEFLNTPNQCFSI